MSSTMNKPKMVIIPAGHKFPDCITVNSLSTSINLKKTSKSEWVPEHLKEKMSPSEEKTQKKLELPKSELKPDKPKRLDVIKASIMRRRESNSSSSNSSSITDTSFEDAKDELTSGLQNHTTCTSPLIKNSKESPTNVNPQYLTKFRKHFLKKESSDQGDASRENKINQHHTNNGFVNESTAFQQSEDKSVQTMWQINFDDDTPNFEIAQESDKIIYCKPSSNIKSSLDKVVTGLKNSAIDDSNSDGWEEDDVALENKTDLCSCTNCDKWSLCPKWQQKNVQFELTTLTKTSKPLLQNSEYKKKKLPIEKKVTQDLLIHGVDIAKPIKSLDETSFQRDVKAIIKKKLSTTPNNSLQKFLWPAIQRRNNVCIISDSGKTMSYLPSMCTFALEKEEQYLEFSSYSGPLVLILIHNKNMGLQIENEITTIFEDTSVPPKVKVLGEMSDLMTVSKDVDILICTPPALINSLKQNVFELKRVCHVVLDDAEILLKNCSDDISKLLKVLNEIVLQRPHNKVMQMIISSKKWSLDIEKLVSNLYIMPTIYIQNNWEAALYGKVEFSQKCVKAHFKKFVLTDILNKFYTNKKTIVFCEEKDMNEVSEYLNNKGVETIEVSEKMLDQENVENVNAWNSLRVGQYKVMLCTDEVITHLGKKLTNANWIVHYSLPSEWKLFVRRFQTIMNNVYCPLPPEHNEKCSCFILDDSCREEATIFTPFFEGLTRIKVCHLKL